jgi:hypothetical protein
MRVAWPFIASIVTASPADGTAAYETRSFIRGITSHGLNITYNQCFMRRVLMVMGQPYAARFGDRRLRSQPAGD